MTTVQTISAAETNKQIRALLKKQFPDTAFRVTLSAGRSSRIQWTDGPGYDAVRAATAHFAGREFNAMEDYSTNRDHVTADGQKVHYAISYVFPERRYSRGFLTRAAAYLSAHYVFTSEPGLTVLESPYSGAYLQASNPQARYGNEWAIDFANRWLNNLTLAELTRMETRALLSDGNHAGDYSYTALSEMPNSEINALNKMIVSVMVAPPFDSWLEELYHRVSWERNLRFGDETAPIYVPGYLTESGDVTPALITTTVADRVYLIETEYADEPTCNLQETVTGLPQAYAYLGPILEQPEFYRLQFTVGTTRVTITPVGE